MGRAFVELFAGTKADASVVPDFLSVVWRKLCFNSAGDFGAGIATPWVLRGEAMGEVALQIIRECAAVARAEGAQLEENVATWYWRRNVRLQRIRSTPCWPTGRRAVRWRSMREMA